MADERRSIPLTAGTAIALALLLVLFAYNVWQSYFLCDDSFISFRYALHLSQGEGPVWNPGERVEGYTNFLWMLMMATSLRLGPAPEAASNAIGIASGGLLLVALLAFSLRRAERGSPLLWFAPFCLAASRSYTAWCTGGLETSFFTLLVFLGFALFVEERRRQSTLPLGSTVMFALASLTRPEGLLFAAVAGGFFAAEVGLGRRPVRAALAWISPYALVVGAHFLWRHAYYGAWLPNTFHAKVAGAWWDQGMLYLRLFVTDYALAWFLPLIALGLFRRRRFVSGLFLCATVSYVAYVAYVGGDRLEFRFLVVVMPYIYWLAGEGLVQVEQLVRGPLGDGSRPRAIAVAAGLAFVLLTFFAPRRAQADGIRHGVASLPVIRAYADRRAEEGRFLRDLVDRGELPADLVICVGGAGALPYYTRWPTVDRRGLNDYEIARLPLAERGIVAHERDAPYAYLARRGVAIFDVFNRVVHDRDLLENRSPWFPHDGESLRIRTVKAGDRYLIFATLVDEAQFSRLFSELDVVR